MTPQMPNDFNDDYELDDTVCPNCGHGPTHSRYCQNFCDDGWFDDYDEDPINFMPGESESLCQECWGTGVERWCPKCGINLQHPKWRGRP